MRSKSENSGWLSSLCRDRRQHDLVRHRRGRRRHRTGLLGFGVKPPGPKGKLQLITMRGFKVFKYGIIPKAERRRPEGQHLRSPGAEFRVGRLQRPARHESMINEFHPLRGHARPTSIAPRRPFRSASGPSRCSAQEGSTMCSSTAASPAARRTTRSSRTKEGRPDKQPTLAKKKKQPFNGSPASSTTRGRSVHQKQAKSGDQSLSCCFFGSCYRPIAGTC